MQSSMDCTRLRPTFAWLLTLALAGCGDDTGGVDGDDSSTAADDDADDAPDDDGPDDDGPDSGGSSGADADADGSSSGATLDAGSSEDGPGSSSSGPGDGSTSSGGDTTTTDDDGSSSTDASAEDGSSSDGGMLDCEGWVGAVTPADTAMTPRPNEEAEQLALEATEDVVAPQDVYDRVELDLEAIRGAYGEVAGIAAMPSWAHGELLLQVDEATADAILDDTYTAWDCANEVYKLTSIDTDLLDFISFVVLHFDGRYYVPGQLADYNAIPGIVYGEPNGLLGDGNDVCVSIAGDTYSYVFDAGSGDCLAGCINHEYWGFEVDGEGNIVELGNFTNMEPEDPWFGALPDCTQWL
jgi:hypothetical protein